MDLCRWRMIVSMLSQFSKLQRFIDFSRIDDIFIDDQSKVSICMVDEQSNEASRRRSIVWNLSGGKQTSTSHNTKVSYNVRRQHFYKRTNRLGSNQQHPCKDEHTLYWLWFTFVMSHLTPALPLKMAKRTSCQTDSHQEQILNIFPAHLWMKILENPMFSINGASFHYCKVSIWMWEEKKLRQNVNL